MVRILWVTNVPLPETADYLGGSQSPFGGWLVGAATGLANSGSCDLHVAFPWLGDPVSFEGKLATHHTIPRLNRFAFGSKPVFRSRIAELIDLVNPDLVHVWGTELAHSLPAAEAARSRGVEFVVSVQGLVGVLGGHFLNTLPEDVRSSRTGLDVLRPTSPRSRARAFVKRGVNEATLLQMSRHIIGRTTWDQACVRLQNSYAKYYHCDEVLRSSFWTAGTKQGERVPLRIFMSQGYEEYKGLHVALVGLEMLRRRIPAVLTVGGPDPSHLKSPYGRLIRRMIRSLCLDDAVTFTGLLSEEEVASHLRSSAVFVLPSALENSPNSLAEAMMLGTPCVASYVGGVPDLLTHGVDGFLYPADAPYMLAHYLHEILTNATLAERLGEAGRRRARVRHNPELCTRRLLDIYGSIIADV